MRKIKFRAWHKDRKQMLEMTVLNFFRFPSDKTFVPGSEGYTTTSYSNVKNISLEELELIQFTGLHDKNGKEIYEGDVVQYGLRRSEVIWYRCGFVLKPKVQKRNQGDGDWFVTENYPNEPIYDEVQVIGNIYENPELLK